jgi:hypothetical protein
MAVAPTTNSTRHFTLRAEYRGFVYERPDFDLATTKLRCDHPHRPALCRYRLSLLSNDTVLVATGSGFPRRDPRRGDVGLIYTEFESNCERRGLAYDIEKQEKCDLGA